MCSTDLMTQGGTQVDVVGVNSPRSGFGGSRDIQAVNYCAWSGGVYVCVPKYSSNLSWRCFTGNGRMERWRFTTCFGQCFMAYALTKKVFVTRVTSCQVKAEITFAWSGVGQRFLPFVPWCCFTGIAELEWWRLTTCVHYQGLMISSVFGHRVRFHVTLLFVLRLYQPECCACF